MPLMLADEPTTQNDMDLLMHLDDDCLYGGRGEDQEDLMNYTSSGREKVF